jgi:hemoglobin
LGEEGLRKILRDFYSKMSQDVLIGFFFTNRDVFSIADRQLEFLLVAMGVRTSYTGKGPGAAHIGMPPILKGHFDRRLVLLRQTLEEHDLAPPDIKIWVEFEEAFRPVVQS